MSRRTAHLLAIVLLSIFVLQTGYMMWYQSPTYDEPNWVAIAGYLTHFWTWQADYHVLMHPPLFFYIPGLPLRFLELGLAPPATPPEGLLAQSLPYPYSAFLKYQTVFLIARWALLPLAIILGWFIYRWASELYGKGAGLLALALYVFHPAMLAYSSVATPDMPTVSISFLTMYFFWRWWRMPSIRNTLLTGILLGCAFAMRASAVLLLPIFFLVGAFELIRMFGRQNDQGQASGAAVPLKTRLLRAGLGVSAALLLLEAAYLFDVQPIQAYHPSQSSDLLYRAFHKIPLPLGAFINGLRLHEAILLATPRTHFFVGTYADHSWWYYQFVTFVVKNPLALVILLAIALLLRRLTSQESFLSIPLLFTGVYFSVFFPLSDIPRYALGIYPLVFVLISRIMTFDLFKKTSARLILGILLGWYLLSSLSVFPHALSYCSELIGGTEHGYTWYVDSNYDWGQDLKGLGEYLRRNQIPTIKLAYFGKAIPEYYGIRYTPLVAPEGCAPTTGLIAISVTTLQGVHESNRACYNWLKAYEPIDKIGYSIFIYQIP